MDMILFQSSIKQMSIHPLYTLSIAPKNHNEIFLLKICLHIEKMGLILDEKIEPSFND